MITDPLDPSNVVSEDRNKLVFTYFELLVDSEIDSIELCENIKEIKRDNLYVDDDLVCPEDEDQEDLTYMLLV